MNWQANWIWDDSGSHPRNQWSCFRRQFTLEQGWDSARLSITADSVYTVYLNGERVGSGPVRGWPSEWYYDQYELSTLQPGNNVIAILVQHLGTSTMQYIEGKGGVIAQFEVFEAGQLKQQITTDRSWKTHVHTGFKKESIRMSNCLPWSEIYDARTFEKSWVEVDFNDESWNEAQVLGEHGIEPWKNLLPRDIPMLTDEPVFPSKTLSLKEVRPVKQHYSIDLKPLFFPWDLDNNSGKVMQGFLATCIHIDRKQLGSISFTVDAHAVAKQQINLNGIEHPVKNGQELEVELGKGKNLLVIDVSMSVHQPTVHLTFNFEEEVHLEAPFAFKESMFAVIGPFYTDTILQIGEPTDHQVVESPKYLKMKSITKEEELRVFEKWTVAVPSSYVSSDNVSLLSMFKENLHISPLHFQHQHLTIANNSSTKIEPFSAGDPELVVDFGEEWLGDFEFDIESPAGAIFDFFFFESLHVDGRIEHTFSLNNSLRYSAKEGRQTFRSFISRGFRYVMITIRNLDKPCKIYSIKLNVKTFPTGNIGFFQSSDYLLNRTWDISKQTVRMCTQDTIIDCPAYEQALWTGDSYNISLMNYYLFGNYDLVRRCLKLISRSIYRSPLPESHVPSGWQNVLTAWSLLWMMSCREYYRFTKDESFIKEIYPELKLTVERFRSFINQDGLLEIHAWNMLDWAPMDTNHAIVTHQNALLVQALRDTAYLAGVLGEEADKLAYIQFANTLVDSINEHLWDDRRKAFIDSIHENGTTSETRSIQTNLIIYLTGCAKGNRKEIIERYLIETPKDFVQIQSPFVLFFYYEAMKKLNRMDIVLNNIRDIYGFMLENGATTCWEGWQLIEGDFSRSHCHAWSAAPAYVFGVSLLGVSPIEPGFEVVRITPQLHGLKWIKGSVPTPLGIIDVSCKEEGEAFSVKVTIPNRIKAKIEVPRGSKIIINNESDEYDNHNAEVEFI